MVVKAYGVGSLWWNTPGISSTTIDSTNSEDICNDTTQRYQNYIANSSCLVFFHRPSVLHGLEGAIILFLAVSCCTCDRTRSTQPWWHSHETRVARKLCPLSRWGLGISLTNRLTTCRPMELDRKEETKRWVLIVNSNHDVGLVTIHPTAAFLIKEMTDS